MSARHRPAYGSLLLAAAFLMSAPAAVAQAGGQEAVSPTGGSGGAEYGSAIGPAAGTRPVATRFVLSPTTLRTGTAPKVVLRVDEDGVDRVSARIVLLPLRGSTGSIVRVDLGSVPTGRVVRPAWPASAVIKPGRYAVRLHVKDGFGGTLKRTAKASGRTTLKVLAKPVKQAPAPTPSPAPTPPVVRDGGVFPVQGGPWRFGDGIGADRGDHRHEGQDILAAAGLSVVSPTAGVVRWTSYQEAGAGEYVVVDAADGRSFFFAHCQRRSTAVEVGQAVSAGTEVCKLGSTGRSSAPHLHFEIWTGGWRVDKGSKPVDPLPQLKAWAGV